ncbi:MAG TPA: molybdopterin dinucleotide binding domain-containing protein [Gemmatimonadaceae bacterium]|nr:molybdopterin dinucleotide binding domain-containing protein [Gemmatimonadaceae bacterium]
MTGIGYDPGLRVLQLIATRRTDPERGTKVWMHGHEARIRNLSDGELVWVYGPRRHELAVLAVDDALPMGACILRDVAGASPSETITIRKVETDSPSGRARNA